MNVDFFGIADSKKRKFDPTSSYDAYINTRKFSEKFKYWLKHFLRHTDVKEILSFSVFDSSKKAHTEAFEKFCKDKSYVYSWGQIDHKLVKFLDNTLFNSADKYKLFHTKFIDYLNKNTDIQAWIKTQIAQEKLAESNDNYKLFHAKFVDYLNKNNDIKSWIKARIEQEKLAETRDNYKAFHKKFIDYLSKNTEIQAWIKARIDQEKLAETNDNYKAFHKKFIDYLDKNTEIQAWIQAQIDKESEGKNKRFKEHSDGLLEIEKRLSKLETISGIRKRV